MVHHGTEPFFVLPLPAVLQVVVFVQLRKAAVGLPRKIVESRFGGGGYAYHGHFPQAFAGREKVQRALDAVGGFAGLVFVAGIGLVHHHEIRRFHDAAFDAL